MNRLVGILAAPLNVFAGPYKLVAYRSRTFGGIGQGLLTWMGLILAYPICAATADGAAAFSATWLTLIVAAWVRMFAQWCSKLPRRDPGEGHSWAGPREPAFALALAAAAWIVVGAGAGFFFLAGYACSLALILLAHLGERLEALSPEDVRRALAPVKSAAGRARDASPVVAHHAARAGSGLLRGLHYLLIARPQPVAIGTDEGRQVIIQQPQRIGWWRWMGRHMTLHFIIATISGALGFNIILAAFTVVLAIPLTLVGAKVQLPKFVKEPVRKTISRIKETVGDVKEDAIEGLRRRKEGVMGRFARHHEPDAEASPDEAEDPDGDPTEDGEEMASDDDEPDRIAEGKARLRARMQSGKARLREGLEDGREAARAEVNRRAKQAMWNSLFK